MATSLIIFHTLVHSKTIDLYTASVP